MFVSFDFLYYLCILKALPWSAAGVIFVCMREESPGSEGCPACENASYWRQQVKVEENNRRRLGAGKGEKVV